MFFKKTLVLLSLLYCCVLISQEIKIKKHTYFFQKLDSLSNKKKLLKTTSQYFKTGLWDSVLVNSSKALLNKNDSAIFSYYHYMRGYSFMRKSIFKESKALFKKIPKQFPFFYKVINNLGGIALEKNNFKEALSYFKQIETKKLSFFDEIKETSLLNDIGVCYIHLKDYENANSYLSKYLNLIEKNQNKIELTEAYNNIANLYYEQYKDAIAIRYFTKAYNLALETSSYDLKRKTAKNMSIVEKNRKNFEKALEYLKEEKRWKDSIFDPEKLQEVYELEKKIIEQEKQKEIDLLALENKTKLAQRNGFIVASVLLLLLLIVGVYSFVQKNKSHKIISSQKEELALLNQTKDKLFSVVSHDLRSSVNLMKKSNATLLGKIQDKNYQDLGGIIVKNAAIANSSYNLLDNLLNWATMQTEQLYFHIESLDLNSVVNQVSFNYQPLFDSKELTFENFVQPSSFVLADLDSLKIIIRNLLDNAIKFSNSGGTIKIYNTSSELFEEFVIEDSGIGMNKETIVELQKESPLLNKKKNQNELGTGLGIHLCKSLIKKNNAELFIESSPNKGSKFSICFPKPSIHGSN
ncbi:tetratricopeptide repeat-containing sensor histidine kinase [Tenacibaculum xiamenense]|uniref:tetratricopeptide repeat-containing sensor histidine kinase n=1 Tax=Tenacibaculum xiamenense TaxID=1261553 RepID=UPI0038938E81